VVRAKAELILKPMTQAPNNVIRDYAIKCDSENNGDDVLTQQLFILTVAIKVTPKSEQILLNDVCFPLGLFDNPVGYLLTAG
jgi:hypothetical protein